MKTTDYASQVLGVQRSLGYYIHYLQTDKDLMNDQEVCKKAIARLELAQEALRHAVDVLRTPNSSP